MTSEKVAAPLRFLFRVCGQTDKQGGFRNRYARMDVNVFIYLYNFFSIIINFVGVKTYQVTCRTDRKDRPKNLESVEMLAKQCYKGTNRSTPRHALVH